MSETITLKNGNKVEPGTWLDGTYGWTNSYRIIDMAVAHGMSLDAEDAAAVDRYRESGSSDAGASDDELDMLEIVTGQGGLSDKATDYMQDQLPEGWMLRWDAGELSLITAWSDCAADGNGCNLDLVDDGRGGLREFVMPCGDHKPERKIRVTLRRGTSNKSDPATYTVALWDEGNEILSGSAEVTVSGSFGLLGGEFWFPEEIPEPKIQEAAEKLVTAYGTAKEGK